MTRFSDFKKAMELPSCFTDNGLIDTLIKKQFSFHLIITSEALPSGEIENIFLAFESVTNTFSP